MLENIEIILRYGKFNLGDYPYNFSQPMRTRAVYYVSFSLICVVFTYIIR